MDYIKPLDVVTSMVNAGATKAGLAVKDVLIRGFLSGAILGFATSLAVTATAQTGAPIVGALIFPVGFVIIVLLGLELVTGSFALVPLAGVDGRRSWGRIASNLSWVFLGNVLGSVTYGILLYLTYTNFGTQPAAGIAAQIVTIAEAKTVAYAASGAAGMASAFVKAILCNWMVCLGVVMAMCSTSTIGKIAAAWLPVVIFFGQGFEHAVVNMFVIPTGMLLGAKVSMLDWWVWNQIPVTLGNLCGGLLFTGLFLYWTYKPAGNEAHATPTPASAPAPAPAAAAAAAAGSARA